jgi:hypothetical protein
MLRNHIVPNHPSPFPVGKSAFRWLLPTEDLKKHDTTKDVLGDLGVFIEWAADDRRLVAYPCSDSKIFNLCGFMPTTESGRCGEGKFHLTKLYTASKERQELNINRLAGSRRQVRSRKGLLRIRPLRPQADRSGGR